jgi:hypothetical protein
MTEADFTRFLVNTPAATQGTLEKRSARSSSPVLFMPARTAPDENPGTSVTLPDGIKLNMKHLILLDSVA